MTVEPYSAPAMTRLKPSQADTIKHMAAMAGVRYSTQLRQLIEIGLAVASIKESHD
jgi:hypothetical protein